MEVFSGWGQCCNEAVCLFREGGVGELRGGGGGGGGDRRETMSLTGCVFVPGGRGRRGQGVAVCLFFTGGQEDRGGRGGGGEKGDHESNRQCVCSGRESTSDWGWGGGGWGVETMSLKGCVSGLGGRGRRSKEEEEWGKRGEGDNESNGMCVCSGREGQAE